ncbi:hypothetical protein NESM_000061900 [Novymonas esmeraldas]|uniref:DUF4833 domain-containing protein n=1 Tax=Novymonas esmeraldas TaxID=1808958 RepID=A0AAW0F3C5_9TRYP
MAIPLVAGGKTVKEDSELFFSVTRSFSIPGASSQYVAPRAFNELVRSRLQQRNRFNRDHHDTCMYIARSKNANVVAYTANLANPVTSERVGSGIGQHCVLRRDDPLHAYFVNLEPSYVEDRRRKGVEYDCDDLNMIERTMAYGCSATPVNTESVLRYWGKHTPEAVAALQEEWRTAGSAAVPEEEDDNNELGDDGEQRRAESAPPLTAESMDAALQTWWAPFHPFISRFVALPTWPGLLLCLPPVGKMGTSRRSSSVVATPHAKSPKSTPPDASLAQEDPTNVVYGHHTEPAPSTATSGVLASEDTVVVIVASIGGELSVLEKVYVQSIEPKRFYNLPKVEYIEVFGVSIATGAPTYEKKVS